MEIYKPTLLVKIPQDAEIQMTGQFSEVYSVIDIVCESNGKSEIIKNRCHIGTVDLENRMMMHPTENYKKIIELGPLYIENFKGAYFSNIGLKNENFTRYDGSIFLEKYIKAKDFAEQSGYFEALKKTFGKFSTAIFTAIINLSEEGNETSFYNNQIKDSYFGNQMFTSLEEITSQVTSNLTEEKLIEFNKNLKNANNFHKGYLYSNEALVYIHSNLGYPERYQTLNYPQKNYALIVEKSHHTLLEIIPFLESEIIGDSLIQKIKGITVPLNISHLTFIMESRFCNKEVIQNIKDDSFMIFGTSENGEKSKFLVNYTKGLIPGNENGKTLDYDFLRLGEKNFWGKNYPCYCIYDRESKNKVSKNLDHIIDVTAKRLKRGELTRKEINRYIPYSFLFNVDYDNQNRIKNFQLNQELVNTITSSSDYFIVHSNMKQFNIKEIRDEIELSNRISSSNFLTIDSLDESPDFNGMNLNGISLCSIFLNYLKERLFNEISIMGKRIDPQRLLIDPACKFDAVKAQFSNNQWNFTYKNEESKEQFFREAKIAEKDIQVIIEELNQMNYISDSNYWVDNEPKDSRKKM